MWFTDSLHWVCARLPHYGPCSILQNLLARFQKRSFGNDFLLWLKPWLPGGVTDLSNFHDLLIYMSLEHFFSTLNQLLNLVGVDRSFCFIFLSFFLSFFLSVFLSFCLSFFLSFCLSFFLSFFRFNSQTGYPRLKHLLLSPDSNMDVTLRFHIALMFWGDEAYSEWRI